MKPLLICYPKCSTCAKAEKWLKEQGVETAYRDISTDRPTVEELQRWIPKSGLPVQRFFNTSGLKYRSLGLKDKVQTATEAELIDMLASDGMLVKRPLLILPSGKVLVGFKAEEWVKYLM